MFNVILGLYERTYLAGRGQGSSSRESQSRLLHLLPILKIVVRLDQESVPRSIFYRNTTNEDFTRMSAIASQIAELNPKEVLIYLKSGRHDDVNWKVLL